ncbi:hypothetical protein [Streptomyces sp. NRRL S-813]|uniref:hypothetical protein n=1 Tax=Streptomyces sp. NRRL S-813 TaxID=1463919 RepID=UPI0004BEA1C7|nr:hypothetical protein [Streptomyces sp. NRRL S-813]
MGQQISVETAFPVFRQRCAELADENLLLRAQVNELEARVAQLEKEQQAEAGDPPPPAGLLPDGPL